MNALEITEQNIKEFGFVVGKKVRCKGTELWKQARYVSRMSPWAMKEAKQVELFKSRTNRDDLYVSEIKLEDGTRYVFDENMIQASLDRFNVKDTIARVVDGLRGIQEVEFSALPEMVTDSFKLSGYKSDRDSQADLFSDLVDLNGGKYGEFYDYYYDKPDCMEFEKESNGDYSLVWGENTVEESGDCVYVDGRMNNYNHMVNSDFWNFDMGDDNEYFKEIDPDDKICIYHRKGKDWYIGYNIEQEENVFSFINDDGEVEEEEIYYFTINEDRELLDKMVDIVSGWKKDQEVKSKINNMLRIGAYDSSDEYYGGSFNLKILNREFEDMYELRYEIADRVDYSIETDVAVENAYEQYLESNMIDMKLFGKYSHLLTIKALAEADGKELVYTKVGEFTDDKKYAIAYKGHENHFSLTELFESYPKKVYLEASTGLSAKLNFLYKDSIVRAKAKGVFVSLEDSYSGGNCRTGTASFCARHGIDTTKIGGIRGDALLELDFSSFTRQAVMAAVKNHQPMAKGA